MQNGTTYIVRPRMQPSKRPANVARISAGAIQLLVGPASASFSEQMKVRSSTRATSLGSEARVEGVRALLGVQPHERAAVDQLGGQPVPFLLRAVAPHDGVGLGQFGDLADPFSQLGQARFGSAVGGLNANHGCLS